MEPNGKIFLMIKFLSYYSFRKQNFSNNITKKELQKDTSAVQHGKGMYSVWKKTTNQTEEK